MERAMAKKPAPKPKRAKAPKVSKASVKAKADAAEATSRMEPDKTTGVRGRPTKYTPEIGDFIADLLANGRTLISICRDNDSLPDAKTVRTWALDPDHPFSPKYTRARELGYHAMADEMVEIVDDGRNDTYVSEDGFTKVDHDVIARARLRYDARKWLLSKALPKIYGDKVAVTDADGGKLTIEFKV